MPDDEDLRSAKRVLSATSLGVLLSSANASTLDVALPVVARHFHASASAASWALLSYLLVYTALLLVFGRLADLIGRRRLYLLGLATLTLASLACGFAPNIVTLDILRGIQAIGAAAIITNVTALLTDAFPPQFLAFGLGLNVTMGGIAQVSGPLLGGFLASDLGWQAVFLFNVPTGLIAIFWSRRVVPLVDMPVSRERLDLLSSVICMGMLTGAMVAVSEGGILGWGNPLVLAAVALALVASPAFVFLQTQRRFPLVDPELFRERDRAMAYVSSFLLTGVRYSIVLLVALYLQAVDGESAFTAGFHVIPVAAGMMIASPVAGRLSRTMPARLLATAGLCVCGVGLIGVLVTLGPSSGYVPVMISLFFIGLGVGIFMTPNTSSIMTSVTKDRRGMANGVRQLSQQSGAALSAAVCLAVIASPLTPGERQAAYAGELSLVAGSAVSAFTRAYHEAFAILIGAVVIAVAVSLLRSSPPAPRFWRRVSPLLRGRLVTALTTGHGLADRDHRDRQRVHRRSGGPELAKLAFSPGRSRFTENWVWGCGFVGWRRSVPLLERGGRSGCSGPFGHLAVHRMGPWYLSAAGPAQAASRAQPGDDPRGIPGDDGGQ